jgi:pimeloyl-ACP methyl ester carboxylesterase
MPACILKDGAQMAYADEGEGPAVLLVHGWATHQGFFAELRGSLARNHRVITPTLRAHPGSARGAAPLTIETLADDIADLIGKLGLSRITALGWSMGAMALWAAWPKLKDRISGLIVEDMAPRIICDADWAHGLGGAYQRADVALTVTDILSGWPAYVARFAPRMFAPQTRQTRADLIDWSIGEMSRADPEAMASFWTSMAGQDFRALLPSIAKPVLVLHGADSQIYPDAATAFVAGASPKGERVVVACAGHVPHLEAPEIVFHHVEAFVRAVRQPETKSGGATP